MRDLNSKIGYLMGYLIHCHLLGEPKKRFYAFFLSEPYCINYMWFTYEAQHEAQLSSEGSSWEGRSVMAKKTVLIK